DIRTRLELLGGDSQSPRGEAWGFERVRRTARTLERQARTLSGESASGGPPDASAGLDGPAIDPDRAGSLLALAYPDRIALRRAGAEGGYLLANGRGASFAGPQSLARRELIVAVDLDDRERNARIALAAPLERAELEQRFADRLVHARTVEWGAREQAVLAQETVRFGAIVLSARPLREIPPEAALAAMLDGVRAMGLECLPWSREARNFQARAELASRLEAADRLPAMSDAALADALASWLAPWLEGVTRREHLGRVPLLETLHARLSWDERQRLDALAPEFLTVPSGSRVRIDYLDASAPAVAVRLQEVFGLASTPRIAGGRIPVTFKLLSPAQRPVQITRDLASFWRGAYAEVRKDLRGRYPKHYWPENPLEAEPTRRVRPRK
ncbi:MAG: ATP-dependent helicase C-terminal domain-containing protein, partial [Steroidobacteraceae bacterium]